MEVRATTGRIPWRIPDFNRRPPRADGLAGKLPSPEGTGSRHGLPVPASHQSLRDEEFAMNLRTM